MQSHTGGDTAHIRHVVAQNSLQGCFGETECAVRAAPANKGLQSCGQNISTLRSFWRSKWMIATHAGRSVRKPIHRS
jgi:hypothetical protein